MFPLLALIVTALAAVIVRSRAAVVPALILAASVPMSVLIWDRDPTSIDRFSVLVAVIARVGFWLLTLLTAERAVELLVMIRPKSLADWGDVAAGDELPGDARCRIEDLNLVVGAQESDIDTRRVLP